QCVHVRLPELSVLAFGSIQFEFIAPPATSETSTLSLHDALPILGPRRGAACRRPGWAVSSHVWPFRSPLPSRARWRCTVCRRTEDRKSTRLNSSHVETSYAAFCLKKQMLTCLD